MRATAGARAARATRSGAQRRPGSRFPQSGGCAASLPCPMPQALGRAVGRSVVEDDELEIRERLTKDALNGRIQIRHGVVHRHDDAEPRSSMADILIRH